MSVTGYSTPHRPVLLIDNVNNQEGTKSVTPDPRQDRTYYQSDSRSHKGTWVQGYGQPWIQHRWLIGVVHAPAARYAAVKAADAGIMRIRTVGGLRGSGNLDRPSPYDSGTSPSIITSRNEYTGTKNAQLGTSVNLTASWPKVTCSMSPTPPPP
jgi:hypothetical protein